MGVFVAAVDADFDNYYYFRVVIPNNVTTTIINGTTFPSIAAPITFDVDVTSVGGNTTDFFLVGRKKPEAMADYNSDGTNAIR